MRPIILLLLSITINTCLAQTETITDHRDNQTYRIKKIGEAYWTLDNINLETELSFEPTEEQKSAYKIKGRYYHLSEIDSVCPSGWQLPDPDHWLNYFEFIAATSKEKFVIEFTGEVQNFTISGYKDAIDIYDKDNPLELAPTGRFEGAEFNIPESYSDFWTLDAPTYKNAQDRSHSDDHVHIMAGAIKGKTHIHIRPDWFTNIHSHDHHLKPKQEKKLRRFMVRCVKVEN